MRVACLLAAVVVAVAIAACSSTEPSLVPEAGNGSDQAIGTACNPALKDPCAQLSDVCSVAVCDSTSHLCIRVMVDAGPTCSNEPPPCSSDECDASGDAADASAQDTGAADAADASVDGGGLDGSDSATPPSDGGDGSTDAPFDGADAGGAP
jgi:hypothetical protein